VNSAVSELSFLIELLLEHKLPKDTRSVVAARIKYVEHAAYAAQFIPERFKYVEPEQSNGAVQVQRVADSGQGNQARAQIAEPPEARALAATLMAEANADTSPSPLHTGRRAAQPKPIPAHAVGVSDAAAAAMRQRNELIAAAAQGISKKGAGIGRGHQPK
jgi:hypothetical protein